MKLIKTTALLIGLALGGVVGAASAGVHCEKCTCNMNTGICECTNCTITETVKQP
jgi:hypothetical protein